MSLLSLDALISASAAGNSFTQPLWGEAQTNGLGNIISTTSNSIMRIGDTAVLPAYPTDLGIPLFSAYILTGVMASVTVTGSGTMIAKVTSLGSFNIGGANTGVFTDGSALPSAAGTGYACGLPSAVMVEVTTATTGTQTLVTVNYKNQGNSPTSTTFTPLTAAIVRSCGVLPLASGDWGALDITSMSRASSAGPTGVLKFWGVTPLAFLPTFTVGAMYIENIVTAAPFLQRLSAGDVITVFSFGTLNARAVFGQLYFVGE